MATVERRASRWVDKLDISKRRRQQWEDQRDCVQELHPEQTESQANNDTLSMNQERIEERRGRRRREKGMRTGLKKRGGFSSILSLFPVGLESLDFLPVVSYPCGPQVCTPCMFSISDRNNNNNICWRGEQQPVFLYPLQIPAQPEEQNKNPMAANPGITRSAAMVKKPQLMKSKIRRRRSRCANGA